MTASPALTDFQGATTAGGPAAIAIWRGAPASGSGQGGDPARSSAVPSRDDGNPGRSNPSQYTAESAPTTPPRVLRHPPPEIGIIALAAAFDWLSQTYPADLPAIAPWDFSWLAFLGIGFTLLWFIRGANAGTRLSAGRTISFLTGLALIYAMVLTRFEYAAQHMFFLNRVQHAVMHHLGPFLIALSWPGATIARGLPPRLRRCLSAPPIRRTVRLLQQPVLAVVLFEGLLALWLVPPVTFRAMLDPRLYQIMNASMVIDGLFFWFLVLDPRPWPQAPIRFFPRLALAFILIFPQIALGTGIGMVQHDIYPSFALCGRLFPSVDPMLDQQIGGLILWIPAGMMSALASLIIMHRMFSHEDTLVRLAA